MSTPKTVMRAGPVVEHEHVARDVDQVPRTLPGERRRGRARAKQR
ncbi:MAG TPA: hypothetical protein VN700_15995 [Vicinamibacterales bacterium]|nr:hypothetical protein [Vicinamibacterales bacterium]